MMGQVRTQTRKKGLKTRAFWQDSGSSPQKPDFTHQQQYHIC